MRRPRRDMRRVYQKTRLPHGSLRQPAVEMKRGRVAELALAEVGMLRIEQAETVTYRRQIRADLSDPPPRGRRFRKRPVAEAFDCPAPWPASQTRSGPRRDRLRTAPPSERVVGSAGPSARIPASLSPRL